jgi:hypothetical protein
LLVEAVVVALLVAVMQAEVGAAQAVSVLLQVYL